MHTKNSSNNLNNLKVGLCIKKTPLRLQQNKEQEQWMIANEE
jgi:hypothetical protein